MKRIVCKNYDEVSRLGAYVYAEQVWRKPDSVLGFSTGGTPIGMYKCLVDMYKSGLVDFSKVVTFNLDEFYPMSKASDKSCDFFMWENLFKHINVRRENVHLPNGGAANAVRACDDYEELISVCGGLDLQLLGIGKNGHIAFNEPADRLTVRTHVTDLSETTIEANAAFFGGRDIVPSRALTMGIGSIMTAHRVLMLITGELKAKVVKQMFSGEVMPQVPATFLQLHPDAVVLLDEAAASLL
ncbi:glucosamine-6-phosphate deaminase [Clostridia bacterium]|nr:glucosamine-6-phosphate deaminase [Clostridia bacterium]